MTQRLAEIPRLHWSYDYSIGAQKPDFLFEFIGNLQHEASDEGGTITYAILPNFWRGYHAPGDAGLSIGQVTLSRAQVDQTYWQYIVRISNSTSGETAEYQFATRDDATRSLLGSWTVSTSATGGGRYAHLRCAGEITNNGDQAKIALRYDRFTLEDAVDAAIPVTCNWALFDVIPALARNSSGTLPAVALLEDLTRLRRDTRIEFLETWTQALGGEDAPPLELRGYGVHGAGLPPTYWWLNANYQVVIVSSIFQTWVLVPGAAQGNRP